MKKIFLTLLGLCLTAGLVAAMGTPPKVPHVSELRLKVQNDLDKMDIDVGMAAGQLASLGLRGDTVRAVLQDLYDNNPAVVNAATIDLDGNLIAIQPATYWKSEGENIGEQEHFIRLRRSGRPVMSQMFKTVEGFQAVSLAYPINDANTNARSGYVSVVFKPDALMRGSIQSFISAYRSVEATAIQLDGRIIYDKDLLQIGNLTFSSSAYKDYPSLLALANRMTLEASGSGTYQYRTLYSSVPVKKSAEWATIGLHGIKWRLMISRTQ